MNVSGANTSISPLAYRPVGTGGMPAAKNTEGSSSTDAEGVFLKYAKMSPMERMRANILKGMNLTEEQLDAMPQEEKQRVENEIKEQIKKLTSKTGQQGQFLNVSA